MRPPAEDTRMALHGHLAQAVQFSAVTPFGICVLLIKCAEIIRAQNMNSVLIEFQ
jgi:hypothetical protein